MPGSLIYCIAVISRKSSELLPVCLSAGADNIRRDPELVLRCAVQLVGDAVCDAGCSGDVALSSGE